MFSRAAQQLLRREKGLLSKQTSFFFSRSSPCYSYPSLTAPDYVNTKLISCRSLATRIRRRRPRNSTPASNNTSTSEVSSSVLGLLESNSHDQSSTFIARDSDGNEIPMDEYLKFASMSPWVPCPDPVIRRVFDIVKTTQDDVHYELGSGDGRVNFYAINPPYSVKKSVGIDIDPNLIQSCKHRIMKRHPQPDNIQFVCADLLDFYNDTTSEVWQQIKDECTILTMYFVEDALQKIKPALERQLKDTQCRIVTIGYEMKGWDAKWVETILGLKVYMYVLNDIEEEQPIPSGPFYDGSNLKEELSPTMDKEPEYEEIEFDEDHDVDFHWDFGGTEISEDNNETETPSTTDHK